jgi:eukaryotic-like serine/threonine-protein kinase
VSIDSAGATPLGSDDPRRIGSFEILGLLGAGGMGEVYLGVTEGRYVAVKLVRPQVVPAERFQREVGILYRIPADVAPRVLASDGTASRPWLATEYLPGLTVDAAVRLCGRLDRDALWLLLADVAGALSTVHKAGVVHRDLNPANVMLLRGGVNLIDFGIARAADQPRVTKVGTGYGTPGFAAPEQEAGKAVVAASADVYSLGALLLYAATGHVPGTEPDIEQLRVSDAELAHIVESCLAGDAKKRPTAAALVDRARVRVVTADQPWPAEVMKRITKREAFAATRISKIETIRPPATNETGSDEIPVLPSAQAAWLRRRRKLVAIVPVAVLIMVGSATTLVLAPFRSPTQPKTLPTGTATSKSVPLHQSASPSPTHPSSSPSPSVSVPIPDTRTDAPISPPVSTKPSSTAARGPAGPSDDQHYVSGSQVTTPGCTGWMDNDGDLYGTVSAGNAACSAEDIRTNSNVMTPSTVTFQASNYSEANGSGPFFYFPGYQFTEQVCIWNQADPSVKACTPRYTDKSGAVSKG